MSAPTSNFTRLNAAEKRSKLRLLDQGKGQITLWRKGDKSRITHKAKSFEREADILVLHEESLRLKSGEEVLANFELSGVSYFGRTQVSSIDSGEIRLKFTEEFYKSERRQNVRVLTFPVFDLNGYFNIPSYYESGKVLNISRKPGQTGLFKSFLKLVDSNHEGEPRLKLRLQDLSSTGMSVYVGPAELEWFKAGEELKDTEIHFPDEVLRFPRTKIVYVVDHIGHTTRNQKQYKVGLRFEELPGSLEDGLKNKIAAMLRTMDIGKDFEEFLK